MQQAPDQNPIKNEAARWTRPDGFSTPRRTAVTGVSFAGLDPCAQEQTTRRVVMNTAPAQPPARRLGGRRG